MSRRHFECDNGGLLRDAEREKDLRIMCHYSLTVDEYIKEIYDFHNSKHLE